MLVRLTTSLAGSTFALTAGQEIELDDLIALVGEGGRDLSVPVETAIKPKAAETAVADRATEFAVVETATIETATKRRKK